MFVRVVLRSFRRFRYGGGICVSYPFLPWEDDHFFFAELICRGKVESVYQDQDDDDGADDDFYDAHFSVSSGNASLSRFRIFVFRDFTVFSGMPSISPISADV